MKAFNRIIIIFASIIIGAGILINLDLFRLVDSDLNRRHQIEINRLSIIIQQSNSIPSNLSDYKYVKNIEQSTTDLSKNSADTFFSGRNLDYSIRLINNTLYRFDYVTDNKHDFSPLFIGINLSLLAILVMVVVLLLYLKYSLIAQFIKVKDLPYQLSKGNLTIPLKESKNRFFGKFIWGLDLLRENIEEHKATELQLQKEKKTLILSISHDIKTPLSAIKLYSQALSKNLYATESKRQEVALSINKKADEIERFVGDIIKTTSNEIVNIEVKKEEFYISQLVRHITDYYKEKLSLLKIKFCVASYTDAIVMGDFDRSMEVLQNIMENAIKYGDGDTISIEFSEEENYKLISIINTGNTLPKPELPHIFESFWRGSNSQGKNGNGLGLYIARQIMLKMHGDIFSNCDNEKMSITVVLKMI